MTTRALLPPLPEHPLVSVIVPSFNQGAFIRKTIESCLEQDYRPIEILVMDGASTDETVEVLKSFGDTPELKWVSEADDGVVDAVNLGLRKARGEIAAIQSSDDYYLPGAFRDIVLGFRENPCAGLVFGNVERVDADGNLMASPRQPGFTLARYLARELHIYQPTAFFRRPFALELGGWKTTIPYTPDIDLWTRIAFHTEVVQLGVVLGAYRSHPRQRDVERERIYRSYLRMLDEMQELKAAPLTLRRASRAGKAMLAFRYGGPWSDADLTRAAWAAVLNRPSILCSRTFPRHRLLPGYFRLTGFRRKLLGPKRT